MHRLFIVALAALVISACTTTNTRQATLVQAPAPGAVVLIVEPDIQLALLTAAGLSEPRADWTEAGTANLQAAIQRSLASSDHTFRGVSGDEVLEGANGQLIRLHEAVGQSILFFDYGLHKLPTKQGTFDWTLGEGAAGLAETYGADYALFTYGRGTYASGGRVATAVALAAFGVGVPLGQQQLFASLVDLRTGQVVWFNYAVAGPQADMREVAGADSLVASIMTDSPL